MVEQDHPKLTVADVKPQRKRRTLDERAIHARQELDRIQELKKVNTRSKIAHALKTLETVDPDYLKLPQYATCVQHLTAYQTAIK